VEDNKFLSMIKNENVNDVFSALQHKGAIYRINGLINVVRYSLTSAEIISEVIRICEDNTFLDGYTVSEFAFATLDLIGSKKYIGNNRNINNLIQSEFEF
jgi:hypothetical protein